MIENRYWSPQQMLSLIGCCWATIGTRYHFCLFSALQDVPFIALQRSDKVADLCWDMNWQYGADLAELSVPKLLRMFSEIDKSRPLLVESLRKKVASMRERTLRNTAALAALSNRLEI
jgi:polysaccharide pyruvyl transferase WcaK-like protein